MQRQRTQNPPVDRGQLPPAEFRGRMTPARPCRLCDTLIRFLTTDSGRRMPVNDEYVKVTPAMAAEGLPVRLVDAAGRLRVHLEGESGYVSHFATCPHADEMRRTSANRKAPAEPPKAVKLTDVHERMRYIADAVSRLARAAGASQKKELKHLQEYCSRTLTMLETMR